MKRWKRVFNMFLVFVILMTVLVPTSVSAASEVKITLSYKNGAVVSVGKTKLGVKTSVKSSLSYKTSNKKIAMVKKGVLYAYKPGKVTITITAKPKSFKYAKITKKVKFNVSPKATSITLTQRSGSNIQVTVKTSKYAKGYQFQYAENSSFKGAAIKKSKSVTAVLSASSAGTIYVRVRPYAKVGKKTVYGKWSKVTIVKGKDSESAVTPTVSPTPTATPQYSYQLYMVNGTTGDFYNTAVGNNSYIDGCYPAALFIKTDNPDASSIKITHDLKGYLGSPDCDDDIQPIENVVYNYLEPVTGGYVFQIRFQEDGMDTIHIYEDVSQDEYYSQYVKVKDIAITVLNYEEEKNKWIDSILESTTNDDMTPFEKMAAVCSYLEPRFRYLTNMNGKLVYLAVETGMPIFKSYVGDSASTPSLLYDIAKRIGSFDDIHNCYGDYERGTSEWMAWHYYVSVTIGEEKRYYEICPATSTGNISSFDYIDFTNTDSMRYIG